MEDITHDRASQREKAKVTAPFARFRVNICNVVTKLAATLLIRHAMTLIIRDQLVNPPTWFSSFRDLTLYCHIFLRQDVVIESQDPDPYFRWMRPRGGMDFIQDFVRPGSEDGVHLDVEHNYPRSVITDRIAPENVHRLIAQINGCRGLA